MPSATISSKEPIQVRINGTPETLTADVSIKCLLALRGLGDAVCAVEVNREVVRKADHGDRQLQDGDVIEIVTLVGGG